MKLLIFLLTSFSTISLMAQPTTNRPAYALVIHGGAGTILKKNMTPEGEKAYHAALRKALEAGESILKEGGSALDAVEAAIRVMEDDPHFNAGRGAVFTNEGRNEMDAAVMNGATLEAGAVAGVTTIRNPVTAARAVMEQSQHVMLSGGGAESFAKEKGLETVDPSYFHTDSRWNGLQRAKQQDSLKAVLDHDEPKKEAGLRQPENRDDKYGTVGACALDQNGNLAAATSTGGMTNKKYGRIGDAPIIGSGTYANNATCAISCTGWGEYFIRLVVAKSVSDMMEFGNMNLKAASEEMIMKRLPALGGDGGLIAVDKNGNVSMPFNTSGMYRGYVKAGESAVTEIYK